MNMDIIFKISKEEIYSAMDKIVAMYPNINIRLGNAKFIDFCMFLGKVYYNGIDESDFSEYGKINKTWTSESSDFIVFSEINRHGEDSTRIYIEIKEGESVSENN